MVFSAAVIQCSSTKTQQIKKKFEPTHIYIHTHHVFFCGQYYKDLFSNIKSQLESNFIYEAILLETDAQHILYLLLEQ